MSEHTAQMSIREGGWTLYVVLMGVPVSQWPEHDFGPGNVPTPTERSRALADLGFAFMGGAEWAWEEYPERPDDDSSPVRLLASVQVCSRGGGLS
ncbi:hypothetical protein ASD97_20950 [Streptomyces sp. Root63]|uniref:DUF6303 family protein n=1 Tax=unclassified Streptomyces TaxID=2593676 RepID=UPI0006FD9E02|nr:MULTISPECIES: DUF6303 family protein [unclassified Streptomyces]KQX36541.1 hypothetical protein ASD29_04575 [Streptomyces sp. Root1295]KRA36651.1 hypothetical protein ASD97_20950 [Streptomyces sp. Root63]